MIFRVHGHAFVGRVEGRPLWHRPRHQYTIGFETKIIMQTPRVMALHAEPRAFFSACGRHAGLRLGCDRKIALMRVLLQRHSRSPPRATDPHCGTRDGHRRGCDHLADRPVLKENCRGRRPCLTRKGCAGCRRWTGIRWPGHRGRYGRDRDRRGHWRGIGRSTGGRGGRGRGDSLGMATRVSQQVAEVGVADLRPPARQRGPLRLRYPPVPPLGQRGGRG